MQINLNILTENNHSSLLSKNVPTADNALLQYMHGKRNMKGEEKKTTVSFPGWKIKSSRNCSIL